MRAFCQKTKDIPQKDIYLYISLEETKKKKVIKKFAVYISKFQLFFLSTYMNRVKVSTTSSLQLQHTRIYL